MIQEKITSFSELLQRIETARAITGARISYINKYSRGQLINFCSSAYEKQFLHSLRGNRKMSFPEVLQGYSMRWHLNKVLRSILVARFEKYPNQPHLLIKYQINMGFLYVHGIGILSGINILAPYQIDVVKWCGFSNRKLIVTLWCPNYDQRWRKLFFCYPCQKRWWIRHCNKCFFKKIKFDIQYLFILFI